MMPFPISRVLLDVHLSEDSHSNIQGCSQHLAHAAVPPADRELSCISHCMSAAETLVLSTQLYFPQSCRAWKGLSPDQKWGGLWALDGKQKQQEQDSSHVQAKQVLGRNTMFPSFQDWEFVVRHDWVWSAAGPGYIMLAICLCRGASCKQEESCVSPALFSNGQTQRQQDRLWEQDRSCHLPGHFYKSFLVSQCTWRGKDLFNQSPSLPSSPLQTSQVVFQVWWGWRVSTKIGKTLYRQKVVVTHTVVWWHHLLDPEGSVHSTYISSPLNEMCHPTATPHPLSGFPGREEVGEAPFWLTPPCAGPSHLHSRELSWALSHRLSHTLTSSNMNTKATGPMSLRHCIGSLSLSVCFTHSPTLPHTCAFRHLFFFCVFLFGIRGSFKE